jgi:hypothetical protein
MKKLFSAALCAATFVWAGSADAVPYPTGAFYAQSEEYVWLDKDSRKLKSYTWTFNLDTDPVYSAMYDSYGESVDINSEDIITEAWLSILFNDDEKDKRAEEYVTIKLDGKKYIKNLEVDSDLYSFAGIETLLKDHLLSVNIIMNSGDVGVCSVTLGGTYVSYSHYGHLWRRHREIGLLR